MSDTLDKMRTRILEHPDSVHYLWHGIIFSEEDVFARLDKTYLYTLYLKEGEPVFQKNVGYHLSNRHREPYVAFSSDILYKVMYGRRNGRILPPTELMEGERAVPVNVRRPLKMSNDPEHGLLEDDPSDSYLISALDLVDREGVLESEGLVYPDVYLSGMADNNTLYPRNTGNTMALISNLPEYDPSCTVEQNFERLHDSFSTPAGKGRKAYPFEHVFGKGVLVVDPETFGRWHCVPKANAKIALPHLTISLQ